MVHRGLRIVRWRAGGDGGDRRGSAGPARRARQRAVGGGRVLRRRAPRLPALHASGDVSRRVGARRAALRTPEGDRTLAAEAVAGTNVVAAPGASGAARIE